MKHRIMLTVTSLLSVLLFMFHWADEIARGMEPGTIAGAWGGLAILFVWLYATLVHIERRWGLIVVLVGALLASGVPFLHMTGNGLLSPRIVSTGRVFFWVWTNVALGAAGLVSLALSMHALVDLRRK